MMRANYSVVEVSDEFVTIQDDGNGVTITNDAEAVVLDVLEHWGRKAKRIFYYDTDGNLDELVHADGRFIRFAVVQTEGRK